MNNMEVYAGRLICKHGGSLMMIVKYCGHGGIFEFKDGGYAVNLNCNMAVFLEFKFKDGGNYKMEVF
jgi:hypothetical protein